MALINIQIHNCFTFIRLTLSCAELSCILSGLLSWSTSSPQDANSEAGAIPWYSKLWQVKHILAEFSPFGAYKSQYKGAYENNKKISMAYIKKEERMSSSWRKQKENVCRYKQSIQQKLSANHGSELCLVSCQLEEATQVQHGWKKKNVWNRHALHKILLSRRTYQDEEAQ